MYKEFRVESEYEDLYDFIDINQNGSISRNEFYRVFGSYIVKKKKVINYKGDLKKACKELFNEIDRDKNGFIDMFEF